MMQYKIPIPYHYVWMVGNIQDRQRKKALFIEYVKGYIARSEPGMQFVKISGMYAVCEKR